MFVTCVWSAARENQDPEAVVKPTFQEVKQPNDVVIDGSGTVTSTSIIYRNLN